MEAPRALRPGNQGMPPQESAINPLKQRQETRKLGVEIVNCSPPGVVLDLLISFTQSVRNLLLRLDYILGIPGRERIFRQWILGARWLFFWVICFVRVSLPFSCSRRTDLSDYFQLRLKCNYFISLGRVIWDFPQCSSGGGGGKMRTWIVFPESQAASIIRMVQL